MSEIETFDQNSTTDDLARQRTQDTFCIAEDAKEAFEEVGLTSIEAVFAFAGDVNLVKKSLASYRSRLRFQTEHSVYAFFMKRYDRPPILAQLRNWLDGRARLSCSMMELETLLDLQRHGIGAPRPVAFGQTWGQWLEQKSFLVTEEIPEAESLERRLPACFDERTRPENLRKCRRFIRQLAAFVRSFHDLGYRHRDLYLAHIFLDRQDRLFLLDLARAFKPRIFKRRFLVKDLAQIHYSMPAGDFTRSDRLRFYLSYIGRDCLGPRDKAMLKHVTRRARRMARHNIKHGGTVPFLTTKL